MLLRKLKTAVGILIAIPVLGAGLGAASLLALAQPAQRTADGKKGDRPAL
jgi:hypothetical protein